MTLPREPRERLIDKVPVEPLRPDRLERLERRVVAAAGPALARPQRPALWPWGLALAGAAAGAIAMYALRPAPPAPAARPLAVTTEARGATLALGDATIVAGPDTAYDVVRGGGGADAGIDVRLVRGAVHLDVAPRAGRPPLWVHAGDVGVRVVGTSFTVTRAVEGGEVLVEVEHGTVEVHQAGAIAPVTGGQRWSSRDGAVLAVAPTADPPQPPDDTSGAMAGAASDGRIGAASTHTGDLATGPTIDVAVLADRDRPTVTPGSASGSAPRATPRATPKPAPDAVAAPDDVPAETPGDLRSLMRRHALAPAMATTASSPQARAAELSKLGFSMAPNAGAALYGLARTQHVDLGQHAQALRTLDAYFRRFDRSAPDFEAARWLRLRILCASTFDAKCRAAAHTYATEYPDARPDSRGGIADRIKNTP